MDRQDFHSKVNAVAGAIHSAIAAASTLTELATVEEEHLKRRGAFNELMKGIKDLSQEERGSVGAHANVVKRAVLGALERKRALLIAASSESGAPIDVTLPGVPHPHGTRHILSLVEEEIVDIFSRMGFDVADGPEVESEWYNFDAVNIPASHPARDMQDTFWLVNDRAATNRTRLLLRVHTSAAQVRYMETHTPPFRIIVPGRIFRCEATDASHEHTFHQFEGLVVSHDASVAHLKAFIGTFFNNFFDAAINVRLRPSFFPFVEPGFEFDVSCILCGGEGCSACKRTGWIEVGGAGLVHQNVFINAGYKKDAWQGVAWGFGIERLAMMKYKIPDIRLFHSGDVRVNQF